MKSKAFFGMLKQKKKKTTDNPRQSSMIENISISYTIIYYDI